MRRATSLEFLPWLPMLSDSPNHRQLHVCMNVFINVCTNACAYAIMHVCEFVCACTCMVADVCLDNALNAVTLSPVEYRCRSVDSWLMLMLQRHEWISTPLGNRR